MAIIEKINEDIKGAMRSRDQIRLSTLRMLKSKILAVDARGNLADVEVLKLFKTYVSNLEEALEEAESVHATDRVGQLKIEISIVQEFLPQPLSIDETRRIVIQAIREAQAKTKKDLGLVMKMVMQLNNQVDGKLARDLAAELLVD